MRSPKAKAPALTERAHPPHLFESLCQLLGAQDDPLVPGVVPIGPQLRGRGQAAPLVDVDGLVQDRGQEALRGQGDQPQPARRRRVVEME